MDSLALLRFAIYIADPLRRFANGLTRKNRQQTRRHCVGTLRKILRQPADVVQRVFNEQQTGGDFHADRIARPLMRGMACDALQFA